MARRSTLHDVEVVDETLDDGTGAPPPPDATAAPPAHRRRWPLVVGAAVLAVLVAVAVTGQVTLDRRERERLARVAAGPSGLPLLDGPPVPLWEADPDTFFAGATVRTPDGLLVGVRPGDGPVAVTATDAATGREVWSVELLDRSAPPPGDAEESFPDPGSCTAHGTQDHLVVCLVHDGMVVTTSSQATGPTTSRLVVLDTRDGTVVTDLTPVLAADGDLTTVAVLDDLVVATVRDTPDGTVVRAATSDGSIRWTSPVPTPDDPARRGAWVARVGDLLAVIGATEVALLDRDGATVRTHPLARHQAYTWNDEVRVVPEGEPGDATTILRPDGDVEVEGYVTHAVVDDGSVPELTLTTDDGGDGLVGWLDGERSWTSDVDPWGLHVLDGRVVADDGQRLVALDARTGAVVWESDAVRGLPATDGRVLLGVARVAERGVQAQMVALELGDGSERWRAPLPDGTTQLVAYEHVLVAAGDDVDATFTVLG